jgi:hypothetical protein
MLLDERTNLPSQERIEPLEHGAGKEPRRYFARRSWNEVPTPDAWLDAKTDPTDHVA